ncbi:pilus assembly protein TadG-related protein [uncultured Gimesia sp.]|uniref:TadE/TadG family type IV pilus assembly protein n=1 Tax=uncultured Gimesia sp. TaxID=1678688 RepID=UPI0030DD173F|tara:strand:- start:13280 stop:14452 length:1173 start_codon:yes stop_codon:yes gene_type:complete
MKRIHSNSEVHQKRRGIAILWLIIWGSLFLTFFCVVLEIATLWQAQVEVQNALDSAALAAVKEWGEGGTGPTQIPRNAGVAYTEANPILGVVFTPSTNYTTPVAGNPNGNASNTGNFVFGAIDTTTDPITFNGNAEASCAAGDVTITITDNTAGGSVIPGSIRLSFDSGTNLAIDSIAFTLPTKTMGPPNAFAYFDAPAPPQVDMTGGSFSGVDVDPTNPGPPNWDCPNPNGDVCFTFADPLAPNQFQTVQINFDGNSFTEFDFLHFGVSTNQLSPAGYPAPYPGSVGDAWGEYGVTAEVTFRNTITNVTSTASTVFVNVPAGNTSEATLTGGGGGGFPAVIAQTTVPVNGFCSQLFGVNFLNASASSIAYYDCGTSRAALVSVDNRIFP